MFYQSQILFFNFYIFFKILESYIFKRYYFLVWLTHLVGGVCHRNDLYNLLCLFQIFPTPINIQYRIYFILI